MLTNYTNYDTVRAALGVSVDEIGDEVLSLQLYEDFLLADLESVAIDLDSMHTTVMGVAVPTEAQVRFLQYARLFATYSVAKALTGTLPMFSPKSIEDGKAKMDRFTDPYKLTIKSIESLFDRWRKALLEAYGALGASTTGSVARSYLLAVTPSYDPITGA